MRKCNLDFETLMGWLKEKYPYSMRRWVDENYWIESSEFIEKGDKDDIDIWDRKPHYVWVPRGYYSKVRIKDNDVQMLILEEADAWLEKVKFEYHKAETAVDYLTEVATKSGTKLNAIEDAVRDCYKRNVKIAPVSLLKILDGSHFTTKDEEVEE